eukprot:XP_001708253.1 Hypothetical protein GL50803_95277 [Giardia lamblia ATCC 50803]
MNRDFLKILRLLTGLPFSSANRGAILIWQPKRARKMLTLLTISRKACQGIVCAGKAISKGLGNFILHPSVGHSIMVPRGEIRDDIVALDEVVMWP